MPEAAVSAETPGAPALSAVPEASAAGSGPSLMAPAEIGDESFEAKWMALGHHDSAQPMPTTHDAPDDASKPAPVTQDSGISSITSGPNCRLPRSRQLLS